MDASSSQGCSLAQVNKLEITTDKRLLAAAGNPHIRLFEVASGNNQAVLTYEGHTSNVTAVCSMLSPLSLLNHPNAFPVGTLNACQVSEGPGSSICAYKQRHLN